MIISNFFSELKTRNLVLFYLGLAHAFLFVVFFISYFVDAAVVLGINAWIKPMKFAISIGAYLWTFGWILHYLPNSKKFVNIMTWLIGLSMSVEMIAITIQSIRGVRSHFNFETAFDGMVFGVMGLMILINALAIILCFLWFLFKKPNLDSPYLLSIRLAFIVFILANLVGGMMIGNGAHSIGGIDGGDGLPFVNWSQENGDLRVAHFLGLHSIQIIPLFAFGVSSKLKSKPKLQMVLVILFTILFAAIFAAIHYQAVQGKPFLSF